MYIEKEDVLQQIALRRLEGKHTISSNFEFQRALDAMGRRKKENIVETTPFVDFIIDEQSTKLQLLLSLSYRLYRINDKRLLRILYMYFFLGVNTVEIAQREHCTHGRVSQLLHEAISMVE